MSLPIFKNGKAFAPSRTVTQNGLVLHPLQNTGAAGLPWYARMKAPNVAAKLTAPKKPMVSMPSFYTIVKTKRD